MYEYLFCFDIFGNSRKNKIINPCLKSGVKSINSQKSQKDQKNKISQPAKIWSLFKLSLVIKIKRDNT